MPVSIDIQYRAWAGCGCVMLLKAPCCPCIPNNIKTSACQSDYYLSEAYSSEKCSVWLMVWFIIYVFSHQNKNGYTTAHYSIFYLKTELIFFFWLLVLWLKIPTWKTKNLRALLFNVYTDMTTVIIIYLLSPFFFPTLLPLSRDLLVYLSL